jgi:hypothetical protein
MSQSSKSATDKTASPQIIPVTQLRKLYEWLRFDLRHLGNDVLHKALAEAYSAKPNALEKLFLESLQAFEAYDNRTEPFYGTRDRKRFAESSGNGTTKVVKTIQARGGSLDLNGVKRKRTFCVVDREVGTLRSTSQTGPWQFSDKRSTKNPGLGGLDLLMVEEFASGHQLPIVCEIKVGDDTTPFFALIQALTYAVELATCSQLQRLFQHYSNHFHNLPAIPSVGLLLLMVETPERQKEIRKVTSQLIAKLHQCPKFSEVVMTTVLADARLEDDDLRVTSVEEFGRIN